MQFMPRKHRQVPAVIIVSLIDVLMVVLIFLVVTTTFRTPTAVELTIPDSSQARPVEPGEKAPYIIEIAKTPPYLFLNSSPIALTNLQQRLIELAKDNSFPGLAIRSDESAPVGMLLKVIDAAKAAGMDAISIYANPPVK